MSGNSTIGLAFLAVGAVSAIVAVLLFLRSRRFLESAVSVQGVVTGLQESSGSEGGSVYRPIVQFTTVEGQTMTFTELVGQNPPRYSPGQTVKVSYPPGNPGAARIPGWFRLWFGPSFAALFAVIFLGVGVPMFLSASGDGGSDSPSVSSLPSGVPLTPGGLPLTPGALPSGQTGGPVLVIGDGSGAPSPRSTTCESVRDRGKDREVTLAFDGGTVTFRATPYTGPGPYTPASNLEVGGSLFDAKAAADVTGAVVFDKSGQAGAINLVNGAILASGSWDCTGVKATH